MLEKTAESDIHSHMLENTAESGIHSHMLEKTADTVFTVICWRRLLRRYSQSYVGEDC